MIFEKMEGALEAQITRFSRVQWMAVATSCLLGVLSLPVFGYPWTIALFLVGAVSYCVVLYICLHPQAKPRRERIDAFYEKLFRQFLGYATTPGTANHSTQHLYHNTPSTASVPPRRTKTAKLCHKEAQKLIELIMRDFLTSWYSDITNDAEFPDDVQKILEHVALEINIRLQRVDLEETVCELVTLVLPYLEVVNEAGKREYNGVQFFDVTHEKALQEFENNPAVTHKSLRSHEAEMKFYRQALDTLIQCAFPTEYGNCDIACTFVRELLLKNIIVPLIDLVSDPDFLNDAIPVILSKASTEKIQRELTTIRVENEELDARLQHGRLVSQVRGACADSQQRRFHTASGRFGGSVASNFTNTPPPKLQRPFSMPEEAPLYTTPPLRNPSHQATPISSGQQKSKNPFLRMRLNRTPPSKRRQSVNIPHSASAPHLQQEVRRHSATSRHTAQLSSLQEFSTPKLEESGAMAAENDVEQNDAGFAIVDLPPIYITRAVHVDKSTSSHTGYILQFPKRMLLDSDLEELGVQASETHLEGLRRYSDFAKFHSTVLKSPLSVYCKGLELPEKRGLSNFVSKLSFGRQDPDPTLVLARKQGLEIYLQCMAAVKEVRRSEVFRQFLKSAVRVFGEANLVSSRPKRKSFLGIVKASTTLSDNTAQQAEPIPKRPVESVISVYLNTHLPLPCRSLHTLHAIRRSPAHYVTPTQPSEEDVPAPSSAHSSPVDPLSSPTDTAQANTDTSGQLLTSSDNSPTDHLSPLQDSGSLSASAMPDFTSDTPPGSLVRPSLSPVASNVDLAASNSPSSSLRSNASSLKFSAKSSPVSSLTRPDRLSSTSPAESIGHVLEDSHRVSDESSGVNRVNFELGYGSVESSGVMEAIDDNTVDTAPLLFDANITVEEGRTIGSLQHCPIKSQGKDQPQSETTPTLDTPLSDEQDVVDHSKEVKDASSSRVTPLHHDGITPDNERGASLFTHFKSLTFKLQYVALLLVKLLLQIWYVVQEALKPLTRSSTRSLVRELECRVSLSNALLALGSEASERHCRELWACDVNTQLAILVLVGGGMERFLWKELHEVVDSEENWSRALYHLRLTLWPEGRLKESSGKILGVQEKELLKQKAVEAFIQFLPNFLPPIVGQGNYARAVKHCIECLQNPRINRHFLLRVIDVLLTKVVPELQDKSFQKRVAQLRTRNPPAGFQ